MLSALSWIPLLGPIIQGFSGIFSKWQDTKLGTLKVERSSDLEEAKVSAEIIHDTKDDIGIRFLRDAAILMPVIWSFLIGWDTIVALRWPWLKFNVSDYPEGVRYLPYASITFLLGNIGINAWKRK